MNTTTTNLVTATLLKKGTVTLEVSTLDESTTVVAVEQDGTRDTLYTSEEGFTDMADNYLTEAGDCEFEVNLIQDLAREHADKVELDVKTFKTTKGVLIGDTYTVSSNGKVKRVYTQFGVLVKDGQAYSQEETDKAIANGNFKEHTDYVEVLSQTLYQTFTGRDFDNIYSAVGFNYDNNRPHLATTFDNLVHTMKDESEVAFIEPQLVQALIDLEVTIQDAITIMLASQEMYTKHMLKTL